VIEKLTGMKETETSGTETLEDTCCVVVYLHLARTLLSGSWTCKRRSQAPRWCFYV